MANSTTVITDMNTVIATGPSATSQGNALAAAGPIQDLPGNLALALLKMKETRALMDVIDEVLDAGDGIKTTFDNVRATFS